MEKKNKISLILLIILTISVVGFCVYSIVTKKDLNKSDALKFRNEYMELNDKVTANGQTYPTVTISETNTIKYVTAKEAVKLLKDGTGIIYFGFPTCPWCRSLLPILLDIAEKKNEVIYYLDVYEMRSTFKLEEGKINKIKDGTKEYRELLELLDSELEEFVIEDEAGNKYDTGEKRLYAPSIVAFNKGKITGFHEGTIDSQEYGFDKLDSNEKEELENILTKLINSKNNDVCNKDKC